MTEDDATKKNMKIKQWTNAWSSFDGSTMTNTVSFTQICESTSKSNLHPFHRKSNWKTKHKTISTNNDQRVSSTNGNDHERVRNESRQKICAHIVHIHEHKY